MKIKDGFMLRQVGGQTIVVAVGEASRDFNGIIKLNSVGQFLWEALTEDTTEEALVEKLLASYEVEREIATADVVAFVAKLKGADLLV